VRLCLNPKCRKPLPDDAPRGLRYCDRRCIRAAEDQRRRDRQTDSRTISVSDAFGDRLAAWCLERGVSMKSVVEVVVARAIPA
jgi:hypothetical protein